MIDNRLINSRSLASQPPLAIMPAPEQNIMIRNNVTAPQRAENINNLTPLQMDLREEQQDLEMLVGMAN